MQIKYAQALIDGKVHEHVVTPSVMKRFEKDLKIKVGDGKSGDTEASMLIWMSFQAAGATDLAFDAWLDTTMATDLRVEEVPLGDDASSALTGGAPLPSPSSPATG